MPTKAKRALRELVTERFCTSIDSFLHAVSAVTRAGRGGSGTDRSAASAQHVTFDVEDGDGWTPSADGGVTASLTKVSHDRQESHALTLRPRVSAGSTATIDSAISPLGC